MKLAIYPGSFDPLTNGHIDIIKRASSIFDKVILAIAHNSKKQAFFTVEERLELIGKVLENEPRVEIQSFQGLTSDFCEDTGAIAIIRGLRAVVDFDYEYAIAQLNKKLNQNVETVFFMASGENSFISSSMVKEVARYGKTVENYVPEVINDALLKKFKEIQKKGN